MRVLIADDAVLVREGLASLLTAVGVDVVAQAGDADRAVALFDPELMDVAILDIRMPPTHTDEGVRAAVDIRRRHPRAGVMVLSQYVEVGFALRLISEHEAGTGYLLKERVTDIDAFVGALHHVAAGGSVLDAQLISLLAGDQLAKGRGASLTPREWVVLGLVAEGRTDRGIAVHLGVGIKTVETHVGAVFRKLGLGGGEHSNRRVRSVLWYLAETGGGPHQGNP